MVNIFDILETILSFLFWHLISNWQQLRGVGDTVCLRCYVKWRAPKISVTVVTFDARQVLSTISGVVMNLGPNSIQICHLTSIGNPNVDIRRSYYRLISTMGSPIPVRRHLYIESGPGIRNDSHMVTCAANISKIIFLNENVWILNMIWLKFVPKLPIDNDTALIQLMAWHIIGDKPVSLPMMS